jgi:RHS repeat-associated protein
MRSAESNGDASRARFEYDSQHRITAVKRGNVGGFQSTFPKTTFAYATGQTTVTDARNNASVYTIDGQGRVEKAKDPLNRERSQSWTANSDVATTTDAFQAASSPATGTTYTYDGKNNAKSVTLPTGAAASAAYTTGVSCPGTGGNDYQMKCSTDSAGNGKRYDYDANGNIKSISDTTSGGTGAEAFEYTYHGIDGESCGGFEGQVCTATDGNGNVTEHTYDADGNLTTVTPPAPLGTTTYTYDSLGRVTSVTDGNGDTTDYKYNERDDIIEIEYDNGALFATEYYPSGLKKSETDTDLTDTLVRVKTFEWDVWGRLTKEDGANTKDDVTYTYDPVGNLTRFDDNQGAVRYTYDAANQVREQMVGSTSTCTVGEDVAPDPHSNCIKFKYEKNGAEARRFLPGGAKIETVVDTSGRPTSIKATDAGGTVKAHVAYSYASGSSDRANIQKRTSHLEEGIPAGAITTYGYDSLNRLTSAVEKNGSTTNATWTYEYDDAGNRTKQIRSGDSGAPAGTTTYSYNAAHQITGTSADTTTWTYDAAGNQTRNGITGQTMAYDDRGAVTQIGTPTTITDPYEGTSTSTMLTDYAAFGQGNTDLLERSDGTTYTNTMAFGLHTEFDSASSGSVRAYTKTHDGRLTQVRFGGGSRFYYLTDHLGSAIGMFDSSGGWVGGYSYSPYGELRHVGSNTALTTSSSRYIGGYHDSESGLYKLGARYYDPSLGRFTQMDPSGQEANPYAYASGNPISASDPSGLRTNWEIVYDILIALLEGQDFFEAISGNTTSAEALGLGYGTGFGFLCAAALAPAAAATSGPGGAIVVGLGCAVLAIGVQNAFTQIYDV